MRERPAFEIAGILSGVRVSLLHDGTLVHRNARRAGGAVESGLLQRLWRQRMLSSHCAARIVSDNRSEAELDVAIDESLSANADYANLQTVPGIGPRNAAAVLTVCIDDFRSHDKLASYFVLAPATQQSGKSINYDKPSRGGNKPPKSLLAFSCNSLNRSCTIQIFAAGQASRQYAVAKTPLTEIPSLRFVCAKIDVFGGAIPASHLAECCLRKFRPLLCDRAPRRCSMGTCRFRGA